MGRYSPSTEKTMSGSTSCRMSRILSRPSSRLFWGFGLGCALLSEQRTRPGDISLSLPGSDIGAYLPHDGAKREFADGDERGP